LAGQLEGQEEPFDFLAKLRVGRQTTTGLFTAEAQRAQRTEKTAEEVVF